MACLTRVEEISEDFKERLNAIKTRYEERSDMEKIRLKQQIDRLGDVANKIQMAYDQYKKRAAELAVSDPKLAEALRTEVVALIELMMGVDPASEASADKDHVDNATSTVSVKADA